jgi:hypothetical protein
VPPREDGARSLTRCCPDTTPLHWGEVTDVQGQVGHGAAEADDARSIVAAQEHERRRRRRTALGVTAIGLSALVWAFWNVAPAFIADYAVRDSCAERASRLAAEDAMEACAERYRFVGLGGRQAGPRLAVHGSGADRELEVDYVVELTILPGVTVPWRVNYRLRIPLSRLPRVS